jgi:hypothetical protein
MNQGSVKTSACAPFTGCRYDKSTVTNDGSLTPPPNWMKVLSRGANVCAAPPSIVSTPGGREPNWMKSRTNPELLVIFHRWSLAWRILKSGFSIADSAAEALLSRASAARVLESADSCAALNAAVSCAFASSRASCASLRAVRASRACPAATRTPSPVRTKRPRLMRFDMSTSRTLSAVY